MSTRRYEFIGGQVVLAESGRVAEFVCDVRRRETFDDERAVAKQIANALNDAIEHPWSGGPDVIEARGELILVRRGGILSPAEWRGGRSWSYIGTPLIFVGAGGDVPTGWRWHPPIPEREG